MKKGREDGEKRDEGGERESARTSKREPNYNILLLMFRLRMTQAVHYHTGGFHMSKQISYMYLNYELGLL